MSTLPKELLPPRLQQIMEYCGEQVMWKVWEHYAGGHLYVPLAKNLGPEHHLAQNLGTHDAHVFCTAFGGEYFVSIPKADGARRKLRNLAIAADSAHLSPMQLARKYKLTERAIYLVLADERDAIQDMNFDLFS